MVLLTKGSKQSLRSKSSWDDDDEDWYDDPIPEVGSIIVHETPRKRLHDTGLVTAGGEPILRLDPPKPTIGFAYTDEWLRHDLQLAEYITGDLDEDDGKDTEEEPEG